MPPDQNHVAESGRGDAVAINLFTDWPVAYESELKDEVIEKENRRIMYPPTPEAPEIFAHGVAELHPAPPPPPFPTFP